MSFTDFLWVIGVLFICFLGYRFNKFGVERRNEGDRIALEHFENLKHRKDNAK